MGTQRFTPEFKEEAVRQIVERGSRRRRCMGQALPQPDCGVAALSLSVAELELQTSPDVL